MNEGAGLNVSAGVDVQIVAAAGDAALHVLAVVPEVQGEEGLVLRSSRTRRYMNSRCSAVAMSSGTASTPTGI